MGKHKIREDKSCLNCGTFVDDKYCPKCGQENKESRESFFHLILEFIFDLVHFDSSFWKTTRYLLFSPAKLSLEYMSGRRKAYVNPIKLYIFISFITFLLPSLLPSPNDDKKSNLVNLNNNTEAETYQDSIFIEGYGVIHSVKELDSIHYSKPKESRISKEQYKTYNSLLKDEDLSSVLSIIEKKRDKITQSLPDNFLFHDLKRYGDIKSVQELDSVHDSKKTEEQISTFKFNFYKALFQFVENTGDKHIGEKISDFMIHNIPKVLFIYMPIFAFWIWLFNLNKRKYYFDSGIFTLHFFSFILLSISIYNIIVYFLDSCFSPKTADILSNVLSLSGLFYITFYFFRANRIFYQERRWLANTKGVFLFFINNIFIIVLLIGYLILAFTRKYH